MLTSLLQDHDSSEYRGNLALLHEACARRLLQLCQSNGGVYIKAAQLITTAQAAPAEYRRCLMLDNPGFSWGRWHTILGSCKARMCMARHSIPSVS